MSLTETHRGLDQYRLETLERIFRDLVKNPMANRKGTWENGRKQAIINEFKRRGIK